MTWLAALLGVTVALLVIGVALGALRAPGGSGPFTWGVLLGLLLSLGGDVALMFQQHRRAFLAGLVLFLCAHLAYAATFAAHGQHSPADYLTLGLLLAAAAGCYRLLAPGLGDLRWPVLAYIAVISLMVAAAASLLANPALARDAALLALAGALLFYLSDLVLAADRFWRPLRYNRLSLFPYFGGQLLIAMAPARLAASA